MSKIYQYTINENAVNVDNEFLDSLQLEGLSFKRDKWLSHNSRIGNLDRYIKTKMNPTGILDYQEFRTDDEKVMYSSKDAFNEVADKIYNFEELSLMDRLEIVNIAKIYNLPLSGKTNKRLVKEILETQTNMFLKSKTSD